MIHVTITAEGSTVQEALHNAAIIASFEKVVAAGGEQILDGVAHNMVKGGNTIGTITAEADTDAEKLAHYTKKDRAEVQRTWAEPDSDEVAALAPVTDAAVDHHTPTRDLDA